MAENPNQNSEQIILSVDLDTSGVQQGVQQMTKSWDTLNDELMYYKDLQKSAMNPADVANYNQQITRVKAEMKSLNSAGVENVNTVKNYKKALLEAQSEAQKLARTKGLNSQEYVEAAKNVAKLKAEFDDYKGSVDAFNPDNKLQGLGKLASGVTSLIGGMVGAMELFGISAENATQITAKLQAIMAISAGLQAIDTISDSYKAFTAALGIGIAKKQAENVATAEAVVLTTEHTVAIVAETAATEAQTVATEGATLATNGLGLAFKAIGIGLIVSAIAALIANWDTVKKTLTDLFPSLKETTGLFDKIKTVAFGVGNVLLKFVTAPIMTLVKVIQGDFKGAMNELISSGNVMANYQKGVAYESKRIQDSNEKDKLKSLIEVMDNRIAVLKAGGKETEALERQQFKRRLQLAGDDEKELAKVKQDSAVFEATSRKAREDKAKAEADKAAAKAKAEEAKRLAKLKSDTNEYNKFLADANKVIAEGTQNERDKALTDIEVKYKKEFDLADKLGKSKVDLEKAKALEIKNINIKYIDEVNAYLNAKDIEKMSSFDKQRKQINDEIDKLLKNAPAEEKDKLNNSRANQLGVIDNLENATNLSNGSENDLKRAKLDNEKEEKDKPEIAKLKIDSLRNAELSAEMASFNLKKIQLDGQNAELQQLETDHQLKLVEIESGASKAKIELSKKEQEAKLQNLQAVSSMAGQAAGLFNKNTVAYKALSIAQTTIDTYTAAQSAYKSMAVIPIVGPALGIAAAGVAVASGIKNVKSIMSVKVPDDTSSSSVAGLGSTMQAPVINSTILKQNESGVADLNSTINSKNNEPIRAYIVDSDLNKQAQKTDLYNKLSSI